MSKIAKLFNKIFNDDGIILIDHLGKRLYLFVKVVI